MVRNILTFIAGFVIGCVYTYLIWAGVINFIIGRHTTGLVLAGLGICLAIGWWTYIYNQY